MLAKMVPVYGPGLDPPTPVRYRFDVSSPVAVYEDLLVTGDSYQMRQSNQSVAG
ncbi:MAG: hypothetical protein ACE1ZZ_06860 [Dehalococcoidia bacterium]